MFLIQIKAKGIDFFSWRGKCFTFKQLQVIQSKPTLLSNHREHTFNGSTRRQSRALDYSFFCFFLLLASLTIHFPSNGSLNFEAHKSTFNSRELLTQSLSEPTEMSTTTVTQNVKHASNRLGKIKAHQRTLSLFDVFLLLLLLLLLVLPPSPTT